MHTLLAPLHLLLFTMRLAMTSLIVDSTNEEAIGSPYRYISP